MSFANTTAKSGNLLRDNEIRVLSHLLEKTHDEFDEELLHLCETYAAKHRPLKAGLQQLRRRAADAKVLNDTFAGKIRAIFDRPFESSVGIAVFAITTALILLSMVSLMIRTVPRFNPDLKPEFKTTWRAIEGAVTVYFTIEFILRVATAADVINYMKRISTATDFLALLPFYLDVATDADLGVLIVLRLLRIFIFFRRFKSVDALFGAVWDSAKVLGAPLIFLGTCLLIVSTILYYSERGSWDADSQTFTISDCDCEASPAFLFGERTCPRIESLFFSIPHTLWWGVVTLTTVGYGDLTPKCPPGKLAASVSMVLGVLFMAMPIAIVGNFFTLSVERRAAAKQRALLEKHRLIEVAGATSETLRQIHEGGTGAGDEAGDGASVSHAIRFLRFMYARMEEPVLSLTDPSAYTVMLLDFYFGTLEHAAAAAPAAVTFELERVSLQQAVALGQQRITLNHSVTLILGARSPDPRAVPNPDVLLPDRDEQGVPYRLSQRHAAVVLPPQYSDAQPSVRPMAGVTIFVNGTPVPELGMDLRHGDVVNLHDVERPLLYRVTGIHPFSLDI